jgi:hypothetical protein
LSFLSILNFFQVEAVFIKYFLFLDFEKSIR